MQQGLRNCRKDEVMWLQYYHLELLYVLKLRARRRVLGLDEVAGTADCARPLRPPRCGVPSLAQRAWSAQAAG
jgi:hypothetical protein